MGYEIPENSLAETIFMDKYAYPGEKSWKECAKRVAKAASDPEFPENREKFEQKFYDAINSRDF